VARRSAKNSCSASLSSALPMMVPGATSMIPRSKSRSAAARASSSPRSAARLGAGLPSSAKKCVGESDVDHPMAPASMPPRTSAAIAASSSGVAVRSVAASPITVRRTAECPMNDAMFTPTPRVSSAARYPG
jgi:hypothetical protein